jgi:hypothetical protein
MFWVQISKDGLQKLQPSDFLEEAGLVPSAEVQKKKEVRAGTRFNYTVTK